MGAQKQLIAAAARKETYIEPGCAKFLHALNWWQFLTPVTLARVLFEELLRLVDTQSSGDLAHHQTHQLVTCT